MVEKYTTLADCVRLAEFAHFNQRDKAGFPYIDHPLRVMRATQDRGAPPYAQMAAVLHDVTEDTAFTCDMLLDLGVPEAAVNIVRLLDRDASKTRYWKDFVGYGDDPSEPGFKDRVDRFYYDAIRKNSEATAVKLDDIADNTKPWRLVYLPEATQDRLEKKYAKARQLLTGRIDSDG